MKILCIGDQHFQPSNEVEVDIFMTSLEKYLKSNSFDYIFSMGDLLHTHEKLHTIALNKAIKYIKLLLSYAPTYVLVGNHDYTSNTANLTQNHWLNVFKDWEGVTVVDRVVKIQDKLLLCPYVPDGKFMDAIREHFTVNIRCVFAHQLFNGAKMGAIIAENVEEWKEDYPMLISGHIHDSQWVKPNLYYTGSAMQHAFGETDDKTLCIVHVEETIRVETVNLGLPQKKIIYMTIPEAQKFDVSELKENVKYKFSLEGNQEEFDAFRKTKRFGDLLSLGIKINFHHKREYIKIKEERLKDKNTKENFMDILYDLIREEEDESLESVYNKIVLDKEEDVLII
jgi:DNA repair exonuclease SbcCD nuclease subunit